MRRSHRPLLPLTHLVASLVGLSLAACIGAFPFPPPAPFPTDARRLPTGAKELSLGASGLQAENDFGIAANDLGGWALGGFSWAFSKRLQLGLRAGMAFEGPTFGAQLAGPVSEGDDWTFDWLGGLGGTISSGDRSHCPESADGWPTRNCSVELVHGTLSYLSFAPFAGLRGSLALSERWAVGGLIRASYSRTFITQGFHGIGDSDVWWLEGMFGVVFTPVSELRVGLGLMTYQLIEDLGVPMFAATGSLTWSFGGER